jgi:hypothetical protein
VIFVAQRQVQDEILLARQPKLGELIGETASRGLVRRRGFLAGSAALGGVQSVNPIALTTGINSMIASTSTSAPRGSAATWYVARAG